MIIFRIQDKHGRGPWRPGFSYQWIEDREDHENLVSWLVEFGPIHLIVPTWEHMGTGCTTIEQLKRWFTENEYRKLKTFGYEAVKIDIDHIFGTSNIQCVFGRMKALNKDVTVFELY